MPRALATLVPPASASIGAASGEVAVEEAQQVLYPRARFAPRGSSPIDDGHSGFASPLAAASLGASSPGARVGTLDAANQRMIVSRPAVRSYMTPSPHSIAAAASLPDAQRLMRVYHLRHLPVLRDGVLCGIVTERDLLLAETLIGFDTRRVPVTEAMTTPVFAVDATDPLAHVAAEMGKRRLGCAVVLENGDIVGIFTTTDVCFALAEVLTQAAATGARAASGPTERA